MVLMFHFSDFSDFQRFLYDKTHQISDFFEETLFKMVNADFFGMKIQRQKHEARCKWRLFEVSF